MRALLQGAEDLVLGGWPFESHTVSIFCVENPSRDAHAVLRDHGHVPLLEVKGDVIFVHRDVPHFEWIRETFQQESFESDVDGSDHSPE